MKAAKNILGDNIYLDDTKIVFIKEGEASPYKVIYFTDKDSAKSEFKRRSYKNPKRSSYHKTPVAKMHYSSKIIQL